jgi:hypothetical protein
MLRQRDIGVVLLGLSPYSTVEETDPGRPAAVLIRPVGDCEMMQDLSEEL